MKKRLISILLSLCMLLALLPTGVFAAGTAYSGTCGDGLTWTLDSDGTLVISGTGDMDDYDYGGIPWEEYQEEIQSVVIQPGVTSIGNWAFYNCKLADISIPNTVTRIGCNVFQVAHQLTSVTIPESVTDIADAAFMWSGLSRIEVAGNNPSYTSQNGILFSKDMTTLVAYPPQIEGDYAVPDGVEVIENSAFRTCMRLTDVTIPDSVTRIGDHAFNCCYGLTEIFIPASVTSIGELAFYGCSGLSRIEVSASSGSFSALEGVLFDKEQTKLVAYPLGKSGTSYTVPDGVAAIGPHAFDNCAALKEVILPDSVSTIERNAFFCCDGLTSVTLPDSVTTMELGAFSTCRGLTDVTLSHQLTVIDELVFQNCEKLTSVTVPESVTTIAPWAFTGCESLKNVYYEGSEAGWSGIEIGHYNEPLKKAAIHYAKTSDTPSEPDVPAVAFTDVPSGAYYADAVQWAVDSGVTSGTGENRFSPEKPCTRAEAVTFLWRAAGCPEPEGSGTDFADVPSGQYYSSAVQWAVEQGITSGTGSNSFSPDQVCSRAQIVTFLWRYEGQQQASGGGSFADVSEDDYYEGAVNWAVQSGITDGKTGTTFAPGEDCTRAQIVTFLYRDIA